MEGSTGKPRWQKSEWKTRGGVATECFPRGFLPRGFHCWSWHTSDVQSISDIRPAFLDNQNGPYKQYGPISGNTLEEGPGEEVKGLISMEMWNMLWQPNDLVKIEEAHLGLRYSVYHLKKTWNQLRISRFKLKMIEILGPITIFWPYIQANFTLRWSVPHQNGPYNRFGPITRWPYNRYWL